MHAQWLAVEQRMTERGHIQLTPAHQTKRQYSNDLKRHKVESPAHLSFPVQVDRLAGTRL
jgi:hypothetical protein